MWKLGNNLFEYIYIHIDIFSKFGFRASRWKQLRQILMLFLPSQKYFPTWRNIRLFFHMKNQQFFFKFNQNFFLKLTSSQNIYSLHLSDQDIFFYKIWRHQIKMVCSLKALFWFLQLLFKCYTNVRLTSI